MKGIKKGKKAQKQKTIQASRCGIIAPALLPLVIPCRNDPGHAAPHEAQLDVIYERGLSCTSIVRWAWNIPVPSIDAPATVG